MPVVLKYMLVKDLKQYLELPNCEHQASMSSHKLFKKAQADACIYTCVRCKK